MGTSVISMDEGLRGHRGGAKSALSRAAALAVATAAGVGFVPVAPGTFGSLVGVLLFFILSPEPFLVTPLFTGGLPAYFAGLALLLGFGVWASGRAEEIFERADDGRIVIDEVVGQLITLIPLAVFGRGGLGHAYFLLVVTGFVTFRVLDIYKPGVIRWAERNISGGAGVMADDCVAGVFGAIGLAALIAGMLWFGLL